MSDEDLDKLAKALEWQGVPAAMKRDKLQQLRDRIVVLLSFVAAAASVIGLFK